LLTSSCGILSEAVLSQSEVALDSALRNSPSDIWERNILGQTPLYLAAGWPRGVARLLEAGADINAMDNHSLTPMLYACSAQCLNTVQQLFAEGSALRSHIRATLHLFAQRWNWHSPDPDAILI